MTLIRRASPDDSMIISGFQKKLAYETENISLDPCTVEKGVRAVFSDPAKGCYYIAEIGDIIAGSLLTTYEWSDWRNGHIIWIQSVYVLPLYRNKGVFRRLYSHIKQIVVNNPDYMGIRLYVDKTNRTALEVYRQIGMNDEHYQMFEWISS